MNSRSLLVLLAMPALLAYGCRQNQDDINGRQTEAVGTIPDTLPPPPIVPGGAGSSPIAATPADSAVPAPPAATATPQSTPTPAPAVIVDVRTRQEYDTGHVKGALLIPYDQMEQRWEELAQYRNQPIVLYCRSGRRSGIALDVLKSKGFTRLENGGGIDAMAAHGFEVVKD